jgi:hypothetical protein
MKDIKSFINEEQNLQPKRKLSEVEMRQRAINQAKAQGCEMEVRMLFDKYDNLLKNCSNPIERKHIAITAIAELHRILNCQDSLIINGVEVLPALDDLSEENSILIKK